ncbi:hypothetical protein [uncultured Kordia sp.]|uniref:hypothetical protein n=1 Tax=uncultured Kordia sp. TaxID=507699 RepID=UPI00261CE36F|nr:hypothetical protein [uncultured Kordia sp.]
MKKSFKTLSLKKSVVSELNGKNSNAVKGGMTVKTQADTLCTSAAIICHPSINFSCGSLFAC